MKAVIALEHGKLAVRDVTLDAPRAGEVLVRMAAAGVCHSDLSVLNGTVPMPLPMVLGHEGSGVVQQLGPGVSGLEVGDHVVLSFIPTCGDCHFCVHHEPHLCIAGSPAGLMPDGTSRVRLDGREIGAMAMLGCMAEQVVVPAMSVQKIDRAIPLDRAALVGCGVMTGVGAVTTTTCVKPGSTVAVFGCGGVGLSVIQGARLVGARRIIAIDMLDTKLDYARHFGATHTVRADGDVVAAVRDLCGGWGADYCFEVTGKPVVMDQAYNASRRGGTVCMIGLGHYTESFALNACGFPSDGRTVVGCMYGNANFRVDMPNLLDLYLARRLDLDAMITRTYTIDEAPQAFDDLVGGLNARGVIVL
ncbi:MAG TPA: Zn-dependent alcohol dehydrogenase [Pseudomonadales bacterium]|nr:Zn-dependent alcohol dehydrogenase [Pseudomonadales bacterium]